MASFLYFFRSRPALFAILMAGLVLALACFARVLHEARFSTNDYEASSVTTSDDGTEALNQIFQETLEISSEAVDDSGLTTMERRTTDNQKDKEDAISGFTFTPGDQSESEPSEEFSRVALENALADSDVFVFSEPDDVEAPSADSSKESNLVAEDPIASLKALQDQIDREEKNNDEMRNEVAGTEAEEKTGFDFLAVEETPSEEKIVLNPAVGEPVDPQESFPTDLIVSSTKEKISALDVAMESEPSELSEKETTDEDVPLVVTLFGDSDHSTPQTTTDSSRNDLDLSSNDELVSHPESQGTTDGTKTEEADSMEIEDGSRVHVVLEEDEDVEFFDILVNNKPASKRTESEENSGNVEHSYAPVPKPFDKVGAEFDPVATDETASTVPEGETNDATDQLAENVVKSLDSTEETVGTKDAETVNEPEETATEIAESEPATESAPESVPESAPAVPKTGNESLVTDAVEEKSDQPVDETEEETPSVNQIWLVSSEGTRGALADAADHLRFWKAAEDRFQPSDLDSFLASDGRSVATVILIHGNMADWNSALENAVTLKCRLEQIQRCYHISTPFRLVIWKWESERQYQRIRTDSQVKATLADLNGFYLASLLSRFKPDSNVTMIGFSFGARTIGSATHLLNGGAMFNHQLPEEMRVTPDRSLYKAVLLAGASNYGDFDQGGKYGFGSYLLSNMIHVYNPIDQALHFYPLLYGAGGPSAIGVAPIDVRSLPAHLQGRTWSINSSPNGPKHDFSNLLYSIQEQLLGNVIFSDAIGISETSDSTDYQAANVSASETTISD